MFQQLEVTSRLRSETAASQPLPKQKQPPPVPVRRHVPTPLYNLNQVIHNNITNINNNNNNKLINNWNAVAVGDGGRKRPGLRVTEEYFIGDLELSSSGRRHQWSKHQQQQPPQAVDRSWDGSSSSAAVQRRISCPGLQSKSSSSSSTLPPSSGLMMTTSSSLVAADKCDDDAVAATKKKNPRRQLRRYLTADSALQLTDNGHRLRHQCPINRSQFNCGRPV